MVVLDPVLTAHARLVPATRGGRARAVGLVRRWAPAAGLAVGALVAYGFTLRTLSADLRLDSPLAFLPLLPLFAAYLAYVAVRDHRGEPAPARESAVDALVGVPLLLTALLLVTALPVVASTYYWSDRPDVLSFGLFVGGGVVLCLGLGWAWRLRWALLFLLLTWPGLYLHALAGVLSGFAAATNGALHLVVLHLPAGLHAGPTRDLLVIPAHGHAAATVISVGSACAGADTGLGFALVGGAVVCARRGAAWRRLLWLVAGVAVAFCLNVGRLVAILLLARYGDPRFALKGFHATVGIVAFTVLLAVMVAVLPRFGLRGGRAPATGTPVTDATGLVHGRLPATSRPPAVGLAQVVSAVDALTTPVPAKRARPTDPPRQPACCDERRTASLAAAAAAVARAVPTAPATPASPRPTRTRRRWIAVTVVAAFTALCGIADAGLGPFTAYADGTGAPTVPSFSVGQLPAGWSARPVATYPWVGQYFGGGTTWTRYALASTTGSAVTADVVVTPDQAAFDTYGVQSCFLFHRYQVLSHARVDLGAGVTGLSLDYRTPTSSWSTVSWAWPVLVGDRTEYERVLLTVPAGTRLPAAGGNGTAVAGGRPAASAGPLARFVADLADGVTGHRDDTAPPETYRVSDAGLLGVAQGVVGAAVRQP